MIDLPGLTYRKVGEHELSEYIKDMIKSHIEDENCLIVMVTPSNQDIGNSETVKIAWEFDNEKRRTICVITKADLCQEGFADQVNKNLL